MGLSDSHEHSEVLVHAFETLEYRSEVMSEHEDLIKVLREELYNKSQTQNISNTIESKQISIADMLGTKLFEIKSFKED